jgi:hypothetical protein
VCPSGRTRVGESGADVQPIAGSTARGRAYERIDVDGNHVVLAIVGGCRRREHAYRNCHCDEVVLLTASETTPALTAGLAFTRADSALLQK